MSLQIQLPMAGLIRVVFFLALASALIIFVLTGVTAIYDSPGEDEASEFASAFVDEDDEEYNRNLGIIYSLIGTAVMAGAILGFRALLNPLRAGLLAAGLIVFYAGTGYASSGSNDWLGAVWSLLALVTLAQSARYLEDGAAFALTRLPGQKL